MEAGLIGLGKMGSGIAKSLLRAGHRVTVYNRTRSRAEALLADGAIVAASVAEACRGEVVFTMVADDAALEGFVFGEGGILASLPRGAVHVSLSTISVALSDQARYGTHQSWARLIWRRRCSVDQMPRRRLVSPWLLAARKRSVQKCKPLFEAMGPKLFVVGERPSMANVVKLSGNFLIATVLESLAEALAFARKSGVDAAALMEFLTATLFNAPVYKTYGALIVEGKHEPAGFALPLGLKDVRLVLQAAEAANVPMPIASVVRDRFITALARGNQDKDWSVIGRVAAEDAGLPQTLRAAG